MRASILLLNPSRSNGGCRQDQLRGQPGLDRRPGRQHRRLAVSALFSLLRLGGGPAITARTQRREDAKDLECNGNAVAGSRRCSSGAAVGNRRAEPGQHQSGDGASGRFSYVLSPIPVKLLFARVGAKEVRLTFILTLEIPGLSGIDAHAANRIERRIVRQPHGCCLEAAL